MKKAIKKAIAVALCVVMMLGIAPLSGFVGLKLPKLNINLPKISELFTEKASASDATSGTCGDNLTWALKNGVLTISGTGDMTNYSDGYNSSNWAPWRNVRGSINSIVIEDGVTSIGDYAFFLVAWAESITIPSSVVSIGEGAFEDALQSMDLIIPNGVKAIELGAFERSSINSVTIPGSVENIGAYAFVNCSDLTSVTILDGVESIGNNAFDYCDMLSNIIIPDSVFNISGDAFNDTAYYNESSNWDNGALYICNHLISVDTSFSGEFTVKTGTKSIASKAFNECMNITSITLPNCLAGIGSMAFFYCSSLTDIAIPESVRNIDSSAFYWCFALTDISVDENNTEYCDIDGILFSKDMTKIIHFPQKKADTSYIIPDSVTSVSAYSFANCSNLTSVTVPDNVTSIGGYAFDGCTGIKSMAIPVGVTKIYVHTFTGCSKLKEISLHDGITEIGSGAFYGCSGLTSLYIADSVTTIGSNAFYGCTGLKTAGPSDGDYNIKLGWTTSIPANAFYGNTGLESIVIPEGIESILSKSFYNCTNLASVVISDGVKAISDNAFYGCSALTSLSIPGSVASVSSSAFSGCSSFKTAGPSSGDYDIKFGWSDAIPAYAFYGLSGLEKITIPEGIKTIGVNAFYKCTGLKTIYIPSSVTTINAASYAYAPFYKCSSSLVIYTGAASRQSGWDYCWNYYDSYHSLSVVYSCSSTDYLYWIDFDNTATEITIPDGVTMIPEEAFYNCSTLTKITIPESVTSVGKNAFAGCTELKTAGPIGGGYNIEFGWTDQIPANAFYDCSSLTYVNIPESITSMGNSVFFGCTELKTAGPLDGDYNIEFGWTAEIPAYAFYDCTAITSVIIPDGVTSIDYDAFYNCTSLTSITIPESVTAIGRYAFSKCSGLKTAGPVGSGCSYEFGWTAEIPAYAFYGCTAITSVIIPDGITKIENGVFYNCSGLTNITIPESVTTIDSSAFTGCSGLKTAGPVGSGCSYEFGWTEKIPANAFYDCTAITSVIIPDGVTSIDYDAFYNCTSLTSITIPESVTAIGRYAFSKCSGLKTAGPVGSGCSYEFGWTAEIPAYAFYDCSGLTNITIPESITAIGNNAFSNCKLLKNIYISASVVNIKATSYYGSPFYGCSSDLLIYTSAVSKQSGWSTYWNYYSSSSALEVVYSSTINEYNYWATLDKSVSEIVIPDGITVIPPKALSGCTSLTSITIPDSVTSIGNYAFYGCTSLTDITFGKNSQLKSIGDYAFYNCTSLTSITIPDSVTSIGNYAFSGCTSLTGITIPGSVTSIGSGAFYGCTCLKTAGQIGSGCNYEFEWETSIPDNAFSGCTSLTSITIPDGVTSIGSDAFYNCKSLTGITIPDSVTSIGGYAFAYCEGITEVNIPDSVVTMGSCAFGRCKGLTSVKLGSGLTELSYGVFNNTGIASIDIPDGVTYVGSNVFESCTELKNLIIPATVTSIGYNAFYNCNSLGDIYYLGSISTWNKISINTGNDKITNAVNYSEYDGSADKVWLHTLNEYTITYYVDGEVYAEIAFTETKPITNVADPVKTGYTFTGWDKEIPETMPAENMAVTAIWVANDYTITFDSNGGNKIEPLTQDYSSELTIPDATREGYTFTGWTWYDADGNKLESAPETMPLNGAKAVANWTINQYTITFDTDGGTEIASITETYGTSVTKPADPEKTGYTFIGWDKEIPKTIPGEDMTITALWNINEYSIEFDSNGGSEIETLTQNYDSVLTIPEPIREGYTFTGWTWYDADGNKLDSAPETMPLNGAKAVANWTINQYTITFDTDGGTEIASITETYGTSVTKPADPEKTGYTFIGWDKEIPKTIPGEDMTITALWNINEYSIEFDSNGGSEIETLTQNYDSALTIPEPIREGYTFTGWTWYDSDGNKLDSAPEMMPLNGAKAVAGWAVNQYTITFDTDGGTTIDSITQDYGTEITTPSNPEKTGYTFIGWDKELPETMPGENVTYTAVWNTNEYTITFDSNGGNEIETLTQDYKSAVTLPQNPTREGYTFTGWTWYDADGNELEFAPETMPLNGAKAVANWTINQYTISFDTDGGTEIPALTADYGSAIGSTSITTDSADYPESPHNYSNSQTYNYSYSYPDATSLKLVFSSSTKFESNYDYLYLYDGNGSQIGKYTGTTLAGQSVTVSGDSFSIKVTTDSSSTYYGFSLDSITAMVGYTIVEPKKEGYTFAGWDKEIPATMPAENMTFKASWSINQYTITIDTADGNDKQIITQDYGTSITAPDNPVRTGYTFAGWDKAIPETMPAKDMTITANWTVNTYTITYRTYSGEDIGEFSYQYGSSISMPSYLENVSGYDFSDFSTISEKKYPATESSSYGAALETYYGYTTSSVTQYYLTKYLLTGNAEKISISFTSYCYGYQYYYAYFYDKSGSSISKTQMLKNTGGEKNTSATLDVPENAVTMRIVMVPDTGSAYYWGGWDNVTIETDSSEKALNSNRLMGWIWSTEDGTMPEIMPAEDLIADASWTTSYICSEGHTLVLIDSVVPTCTEDGESGQTFCPTCKKILDDGYTLPAYGHDYASVVTRECNCTEDGVLTKSCNRCGDTLTETIDATGHSRTSEEVTTEPTCTEEGVRTVTCHCGYSWTESIPATGHTYGSFKTIKKATCDEEGIMRYTCTVCGYSYDETIKSLEHNIVEIEAKDPTCTEDGCTYGKYCSRCNKVYSQSETIPALGHSYEQVTVKSATCTEDGQYINRCSRCNCIEAEDSEQPIETSTVINSSSYVYPHTDHNYSNNMNRTYSFSYPGATKLVLKFSSSCYFESGYDNLYLYDKDGKLAGSYTGSSLQNRSIVLDGSSFSIKVTTDGSVTYYGFSLDSITAVTLANAKIYTLPSPGHDYQQVVLKKATCQEIGEYALKCSVCGKYESASTPVYEAVTADKSTYPETPHNYEGSQVYNYEYSYPGSKELTLTFSDDCMLESNYDYLYLYDGDGNLIGTYTGPELQGASVTVEDDTFLIKVTTDENVNHYGFSLTSIVAQADVSVAKYTIEKTDHDYTESVAKAATPLQEGQMTHICKVCGYSYTSVIPKTVYAVGEVISYGSYPQSKVVDENTLDALNALSVTWHSYGYYSGTGNISNGKMESSDYMYYADATYKGEKYRAVTFSTYRPHNTGLVSATLGVYSNQDENNYYTNKVYWFKYDPIQWRILDPTTGLVMCETVIDSQPYNNYINGNYTSDGNYANDYAHSSIRQWLNDDFYNTAFTDEQKANVLTTDLNNKSCGTLRGDVKSSVYDSDSTSDKVFLLSYDEVLNNDYGFSTSEFDSDTRTVYKGTDYARCQGLGYDDDGVCNWYLRTALNTSGSAASSVIRGSLPPYSSFVGIAGRGIRPAIRLSNITNTGGATSSDEAYTVTYKIGDEVVGTVSYTAGAPVVSIATKELVGCSFSGWSEPDEMPEGNITLTGEYLTNYTAKFVADGVTVDEVEYTTATTTLMEPAVPEKEGYTGTWEEYSLTTGGITINAVYTLDGDHVHNYTSTVTKAATCTESGEKTFTCACGDSYKETIPALGHDLVKHDAKAPTCTEAGWEAYETCSGCSYTTYKEIPATGHSFTNYVYNNDATTEKDGTKTAKCDNCDLTDTITAEGTKLAPGHEHSYTEKVTAPTCTEKGYTTYTCLCGFSYTGNYVDALGHSLVKHNAKAATCTEAGWAAYETCSRCNYTTYKEVPATGHPDADQNGYCDVCGTLVNADLANPCRSAKLNANSGSVDYRTKVTLKATATGVPTGYYVAIYDGNTQVARGDNSSVSYSIGEMKSGKTYTVKIVDANGNVQKDASGNALQKDVTINVNTSFIKKLVAFFKGLFGSLPSKTIGA